MSAQKKQSAPEGKKGKKKPPKRSRKKGPSGSLKLNFVQDHRQQLLITLLVLGAAIVTVTAYLLTTILTNGDGIEPDGERLIDISIGSNITESEPDEPTVLPRRIDGILVAASQANQVPACVMIENAAFGGVRPQSGLSRASVVYELVVEGGITRFMALYAGEESELVGPVRSARDTYLEFASEYNCAYFHAGGSFTAMLALSNFRLRDVDGLREPQYFWRQGGKVSPHNLFTSTEQLYEAIANHSWTKDEPPSYDSWNFVEDDQLSSNGEPNSRARIYYGGSYDVEYSYNAKEGYYERLNGGVPQTDEVNGEKITARNVIFQHVGAGTPIEGKGRINWPVTGEGEVDIFTNGRHVSGSWEKTSRQSRTKFYTETGEEIQLARGNSWISIIPNHITFDFE